MEFVLTIFYVPGGIGQNNEQKNESGISSSGAFVRMAESEYFNCHTQ